MLAPLRRTIARDHGAVIVLAWVAAYTLGLPAVMRTRRRDEIAADLAEEGLDAVRRGTIRGLRSRRLIRLALGIPADLAWRLVDAPAMAADLRIARPWVPPTRWSLALLAIVAVCAAGGFVLVAVPMLSGSLAPGIWGGAGPAGVAIASLGVLVGIVAAVPAPRGATGVVVIASALGMVVAPAVWGCWSLAVVAALVRLYQAETGAPWR